MLSLRVALVLGSLVALADVASAGPDLDKVVWIVRCVGDSLGGNACHG